ncbi:MAG: CvpA family protein [Bacilli bacterium]|nr:CvpA family protein [Bacilli bacterium]
MQFDYFIIVFIVIGFIYGMYRGIKKELSFFVVFSIAVFLPLYLYDFIKSFFERFVLIESVYNKLHILTDSFNISYNCFEFLVVYLIPFILINIILNGILYLAIFNRLSIRRQTISTPQRLFGGLLGLVVGIELSIVMMLVLNGVMDFNMDGFISLTLAKIPQVQEFLDFTSRVIEEVA